MSLAAGSVSVEGLAQALHEAGREAVERGLILHRPAEPPPFVEWADCAEHVREGRRVQVRWLLQRYVLVPR